MRQFFKIFLLFSLAALTSAGLAQAEPNAPIIAIVVASNQKVDVLKLAPNDLSLIYWRKQLYWPKGQRIKPVNLSTEHPLRLQFSQTILGGLPKTQIDYWNGQYFNGVLPPYSVNSEEAVLRYVAQTDGAIGYINACSVDVRVKTLFWIVNDQLTANVPENLDCK
jgi:ABC-type phosphate transport system substrate-binding protein